MKRDNFVLTFNTFLLRLDLDISRSWQKVRDIPISISQYFSTVTIDFDANRTDRTLETLKYVEGPHNRQSPTSETALR